MKISDRLRATHDQDGAILLDIRQGQMFRLNLVAWRALELLRNGLTESQIASHIATEFEAQVPDVARDLGEFFERLIAHGLLETAGPGSQTAA